MHVWDAENALGQTSTDGAAYLRLGCESSKCRPT